MLVPSIKCTKDADCAHHNVYDSSKSQTYQPNGTAVAIQHFGFYSSGFASMDTLRVGDLIITNQSFEEATELKPNYFVDDVYDSILGLPLRPVGAPESSLGATSAFHNMISQKLLDENLFSMKLSDSTVGRRGELLFGSVNDSLYDGQLHSFSVIDISSSNPDLNTIFAPGWQVAVSSCALGFENEAPVLTFNLSLYTAVFSTAFARLALPERVVMSILDYLDSDGRVECDRRDAMPDLIIDLGSRQAVPFVLKPHDYIRYDPQVRLPGSNDKCRVQFYILPDFDDEPPFIVLGSVFLARWYSVFNYDEATVSRKFLAIRNTSINFHHTDLSLVARLR